MTASKPHRIGLLAGSGQYPIHFARGARLCGHKVVAVAIEEEADPKLADHVDEIHWAGVGHLVDILNTFREARVTEVVLTGKIHKTHLFNHVTLDDQMKKVIASLPRKDDVSLLCAIAREFERTGLKLREPTAFLEDLQAAPGVLTRRSPTVAEMADVNYGFTVAKNLADLGIGQTVVVKGGVILAVEAIEGTDKTIERAGTLVPDGLVVVKVGSRNQDRRFDMPVVGMETMKVLVQSHVTVLAIDAANTVILDRESLVEEADRQGMSFIAV
ncbi:MAG: UDP-2,3-diacylglucosamine diphosphatase LpxI [Candidatus Riflebacteria bacterium]|nr:UDP-2,3-diacylglucosamine diphosphatase LpxI [Candidatus Riflebacteria bacterium]